MKSGENESETWGFDTSKIDFVKCPPPRREHDLSSRFKVATDEITTEAIANELMWLHIDKSNLELGGDNLMPSTPNVCLFCINIMLFSKSKITIQIYIFRLN